jgi:hypothetical protein
MERRENKTILYFGYGANASGEMMEAIIGRKPKGFTAQLKDYELWIQLWQEIPSNVRNILGIDWNSDFKTYCISPQRGGLVNGRVWLLTPKERRLVSNWEFWYQPIKAQARMQGGKLKTVETEMIRKRASEGKKMNGERYKLFLNSTKRMLEVAKKERIALLK